MNRPVVDLWNGSIERRQFINLNADRIRLIVDVELSVVHEAPDERTRVSGKAKVGTEEQAVCLLPQIVRKALYAVASLEHLSIRHGARKALPDVEVLLKVNSLVMLHLSA